MTAAIVLTPARAATEIRTAADRPPDLAPVSCPELLKLLRAPAPPPPARDSDHAVSWSAWQLHHQTAAQARHRRRHQRHEQVT
ncbi:hypothetical protein [Streptomyces sp. NPDC057910]|uniref:hypothetical protein n=1 Tax=Streptomyces sp. NPDC057910 TaxID=3346278 RepID=UPI0036EB0E8C